MIEHYLTGCAVAWILVVMACDDDDEGKFWPKFFAIMSSWIVVIFALGCLIKYLYDDLVIFINEGK